MSKKIPVSGGHFAIVDDEDYASCSRYKWYAYKTDRCVYAKRNLTAKEQKSYGKTSIPMHREILGLNEDCVTDHINHNGLDNRRSNLRSCSQQQNCYNKRGKRNTSSKYKGVGWNKRLKKWEAVIKAFGRNIKLGSFDEEVFAAEAYNVAAVKCFGEFAYQNEI